MAPGPLIVALALVIAGDSAPPVVETAADEVTLRDGKVLRGQVFEPAPRGTHVVLVRRAWAEAELPDWYARWKNVEAPGLRRARTQRRDRLSTWRRSRAPFANPDDAVLAWLDREIARLGDPAKSLETTLMAVKLSRGEVQLVVRRPKGTARMLRLGWVSGFPEVESMPLDRLAESLEGRGFVAEGDSPVSLDHLLPLPIETEVQWTTRRAATEVATDSGLKFVRTGSVLLPEPEPGQPLQLGGALSALSDLTRLLEGDRASDPLAESLGKIAARGRIGALVTQLEISPDFTLVRVNATLWVRRLDRWYPAGSRTAAVRPGDLAANAGAPLAEDPQVKGLFKLVESIGLGQVPEELKQRSLNVGAATQKALGQVRSTMLEALNDLVLPIHEQPAAEARP